MKQLERVYMHESLIMNETLSLPNTEIFERLFIGWDIITPFYSNIIEETFK